VSSGLVDRKPGMQIDNIGTQTYQPNRLIGFEAISQTSCDNLDLTIVDAVKREIELKIECFEIQARQR
jgi:hypothetical protein